MRNSNKKRAWSLRILRLRRDAFVILLGTMLVASCSPQLAKRITPIKDSASSSSSTNNGAPTANSPSAGTASGAAAGTASTSSSTAADSSSSRSTSASSSSDSVSCTSTPPISPKATGKTYYVSPSGNDGNDGLKIATAWQTTSNLHNNLTPGDTVLFEGGQSYAGGLYLGPGQGISSGTATNPVFISTYGTGKASFACNSGIFIWNAGGYDISNLRFSGCPDNLYSSKGITTWSDDGVTHPYIHINNVEVSGFYMGFDIDGQFSDISITNSSIHDNHDYGIYFGSGGIDKIYLGHNEIYNISNATGYAVYYFYANNSLSEYNVIHDIGGGDAKYGAGFATLGANHAVFQYNEIYNINPGNGQGDDGIIIDACSQNVSFQYNYVHDVPSGLGITLSDWGDCAYDGMVIRYNLVVNCGNGLTALGSTTQYPVQANIYNNTFISNAGQTGMSYSYNIGTTGVYNNAFVGTVKGTKGLEIYPDTSVAMQFLNNGYYAPNELYPFGYQTQTGPWTTYKGLIDFQAGSGQEGGSKAPVGVEANPLLNVPATAPTVGIANINTMPGMLSAYKLSSSSPFVGRGLDLKSAVGIDPGNHDFWCQPVSSNIGN